MSILSVQNISKRYKLREVVKRISLEIRGGEVVGLLGPNGAGKTTAFYMIVGLINCDQGRILLDGKDLTPLPMHKRAGLGLGYLPQEASIFRKLTVEQNLLSMMEMLGKSRSERHYRCDELLEHFHIDRLRKSRAQSLSGGERRRLEIARCLVSDPEIILLDEPFTGIDPVTINDIQLIIRDLRDRGISILITDHQVRETLEITDRSYVIRDGKVLCHGRPEEVVQHPEARKYYFGESMDVGNSRIPAHHFPADREAPDDGRISRRTDSFG